MEEKTQTTHEKIVLINYKVKEDLIPSSLSGKKAIRKWVERKKNKEHEEILIPSSLSGKKAVRKVPVYGVPGFWCSGPWIPSGKSKSNVIVPRFSYP